MGIHDRDYFRPESTYHAGRATFRPRRAGGGFVVAMRQSPVVFALVFANIAMYIAQMLTIENEQFNVTAWLILVPSLWHEAWRFIGFQFLHGNFNHLLFNMLAVFMFGRYLEAKWGGRRFLIVYLACGIFAGVVQVCTEMVMNMNVPVLGASGGVSAILGAVAVLFPQIKVIMFPIFIPISIRIVVVIFFVISLFSFQGDDGTAHAAHLGGLVAGLAYTILWPRLMRKRIQKTHAKSQSCWEDKLAEQVAFQQEIDRVLQKIQNRGIVSLTQSEKNLLAEATRRQQEEDRRINRM
ncbi:MAG: rhomboid family intramembrane serine protease [Phycisphaerales bacterium]|jgi:membrane associated rhomboid family serine protease|nr:rhomboid family intramembrane serine protease [Phycisphaerales bacterium]MBT7170865.1 rhomboid family intramembrane serine protease [Phycisphaerales bacterium]